MALNAPTQPKEVSTSAAKAEPAKVRLELALYERYTRMGYLYTKKDDQGRNRVYLFTQEQALILLQEVEESTGRPIWRRPRDHKETQKLQEISQAPVEFDATGDKTLAAPVDSGPVVEAKPEARIEVGSEDELRGILGEESGIVTV